MKIKEALKLVAGSVAIYIAVACSSASGPGLGVLASDGPEDASSPNAMPGTARDTGTTHQTGTTRDTGTSMIDALTDPVPVAMADPNQSGSRLKANYYVGADGSKTFAGMHDSQLNADCSFNMASDGTTRCLPAYGKGAALAASYFSDSGCSQPLAYLVTGCSQPSYAQASVSSSCAITPAYRIYPVTGVFSGTAYAGTPASCTAAQPGSTALYALGPEISPSTFVQATLQTDP